MRNPLPPATGWESEAPTPPQDLVYALAACARNPSAGPWFAARDAGLFRSEDRAHSWRTAYESLNPSSPLATLAVALVPACETDQTLFAGVQDGVLRSIDGGRNWQFRPLQDPPPMVVAIAVSPDYEQDGTVFAGTLEDGVFRSLDRGDSWTAWNFGLLDLRVAALAVSPSFAQDRTLFAATESGVYCSQNRGRSWRELGLPPDLAPFASLAVSPGFASDGTVFAGSGVDGLYVSHDRGLRWARLAELQVGGAIDQVLLDAAFPRLPYVLIIAEGRLLVSLDGGQRWELRDRDRSDGVAVTAVAAPLGIRPGGQVLAGLDNGEVEWI